MDSRLQDNYTEAEKPMPIESKGASIGVKFSGLLDADIAKFKKILQLSANRNRKYYFGNE